MSVKSEPYYWLVCDHDGCGITSTEDTEYTAWSDEGHALDSALDSEWIAVGDKHYCHDHAHLHDPDLKEES